MKAESSIMCDKIIQQLINAYLADQLSSNMILRFPIVACEAITSSAGNYKMGSLFSGIAFRNLLNMY